MATLVRLLFSILMVGSLMNCASRSKEDHERAALYMRIGSGRLAQGQYPQAMSDLMQAARLDPNNPLILNNLGIAYYVRGRVKESEEKYRKAIKIEKNFSDAKNNLARVLIDTGRAPEALRILREVEGDLTYQNPEKTLGTMGIAYFESQNYKKAEEYLARALEVRRDNCTTGFYYARTLYEMKRTEQSAEAFDQAVNTCRASKFEDPLYFSAMSYFALGNKEKSRARLEELLKEYPKSKYVAKAKGMLELLAQ